MTLVKISQCDFIYSRMLTAPNDSEKTTESPFTFESYAILLTVEAIIIFTGRSFYGEQTILITRMRLEFPMIGPKL